jgi:hypothetical protein
MEAPKPHAPTRCQEVAAMAKCRPNVGAVVAGALVGAAVAFLLVPESRRWAQRQLRNWMRDVLEDDFEHDGVHEEAGATEGGLAATRGWQP